MGQTSANTKTEKNPIFKAFLFPAIVALCSIIALIFFPARMVIAFDFSVKLLFKLLPILLLVFTLIFIINLLIKPKWIQNHVGHDSGLKGMIVAMTAGIISMGPIYIWYGLLKEFQKKGMKPSLVAVFLYSRSVKLPLLPLMLHYFGSAYTFILTFYILLFSLFNGLITEWLLTDKKEA